jgi:hypothetical protein
MRELLLINGVIFICASGVIFILVYTIRDLRKKIEKVQNEIFSKVYNLKEEELKKVDIRYEQALKDIKQYKIFHEKYFNMLPEYNKLLNKQDDLDKLKKFNTILKNTILRQAKQIQDLERRNHNKDQLLSDYRKRL